MAEQDILQQARAVIEQEGAAVQAIAAQLDESMVRAAEMMLACEGHVLVGGVGTSRHVAARMAHLLSCCGTPALFIHPGDSQHGLAGAVTGRDVLLVISKGGQTAEVNFLAELAKKRGARLIAMSEKPDSPLAQCSDVLLHIQAPAEVDPFGMIATGSSLIHAAVCDALCVMLLRLRGYTRTSFGETHPGGAVGVRLSADQERV